MVILAFGFPDKLQLRNIRAFVSGKMRHSMDIRVFDRSFIWFTQCRTTQSIGI